MPKSIDFSANGTTLPIGFDFAPDGSLKLTGEATVWNDQFTNYIKGENTQSYSLVSQTYEQEIPYGVYKDSVWVKLNIDSGKSVTLKFYPDTTKASDNDKVFLLYDDFNTTDSSKWVYQNATVSGSVLKVNGGNNIFGPKSNKVIPDNVIIEWNMYSGNYDFDSGFRVGNLYFISHKGSGNQAISTSITYPSGSQQANTWNEYQVILKNRDITFTNTSVNKKVTSTLTYNPGQLQWFCDSDTSSNPLRVDYICVRKYYDESKLTINVTNNEDGSYTVEITNNGEELKDTEIKIPGLPVDYYKATVVTTTPVLECESMPAGVDSNYKFYTQFNHQPKYDSECAFHIHAYIPPDSPTGKVKLRLTWQVIPVEIITDETNTQEVRNINKIIKQETRVFNITEDMRGRHVLLNFGRIDKVNSLSQIVFHKLERLGTDPEDTYPAALPILYMDWHTEIDTLGSQDEFKK